MHSYFFKNFIMAALLLLLSFIVFGASFLGLGRAYMQSERQENLETNVEEISQLATAYSRTGRLDDLSFRMVLSTLSKTSSSDYLICDLRGNIMSCSHEEFRCPQLGKTIDPSIMRHLSVNGSYSSLDTLGGIYSKPHYLAALPIFSPDGAVLAYVFAASDASNLINIWNTLYRIFFISTLIIMAITLIISFVSARNQSKPVNEIARASRRFAHGDFSVRVSGTDRPDEIGALATSFNQMAESLELADKRRSDFLPMFPTS